MVRMRWGIRFILLHVMTGLWCAETAGKTMFLRSLPSLLHELLETQWDTCKAYVLRAIDKPGAEDEAQHFLEVLQRSVDPMHQMVIWLRQVSCLI